MLVFYGDFFGLGGPLGQGLGLGPGLDKKRQLKTKMCISVSFPISKLTIVSEYFRIDVFHSPLA